MDFNRRGRNGYVIGSSARADGPVEVDDIVELYQPGEEDMNPVATVVTIDSSGRVELDVLWDAKAELSSVLAAIIQPGLYASAPTSSTFGSGIAIHPAIDEPVR